MKFDENSDEPITTPDGVNETKINPDEGTDPQLDKSGNNKWNRLSKINTEFQDSFGNRNDVVVNKQDRMMDFDVIASHLELPKCYRREGREIMSEIDMKSFSGRKVTTHLISFCIAACLIRRDNLDRTYHPARSDENNDHLFVETAEEFGFQPNIVNRYLQKVDQYV